MIHPVWVGDFGKQNMSASSNLSAAAQVRLYTCTFGRLPGLLLTVRQHQLPILACLLRSAGT
jgi:hypothetical protein